jgi:hypothetical protein
MFGTAQMVLYFIYRTPNAKKGESIAHVVDLQMYETTNAIVNAEIDTTNYDTVEADKKPEV